MSTSSTLWLYSKLFFQVSFTGSYIKRNALNPCTPELVCNEIECMDKDTRQEKKKEKEPKGRGFLSL